jgi:hypothetical protein
VRKLKGLEDIIREGSLVLIWSRSDFEKIWTVFSTDGCEPAHG